MFCKKSSLKHEESTHLVIANLTVTKYTSSLNGISLSTAWKGLVAKGASVYISVLEDDHSHRTNVGSVSDQVQVFQKDIESFLPQNNP